MTNIDADWTGVKDFATDRDVSIQYIDYNGTYYISAFDGMLSIETSLSQEDPTNVDLIDFETNYKPTANLSPTIDILKKEVTHSSGSLGALNDTFDINCSGLASVQFYISDTYDGEISFYLSVDDIYFQTAYAFSGSDPATLPESSTTFNNMYKLDVTGWSTCRLKMTTYVSGAVTVTAIGSKHPSVLQGILGLVEVAGYVRLKTENDSPINLGQAVMTASLPVVIAADQSLLSVADSASASIDAKTASLGQTNMLGSSPVVIANNQSAIPTTIASLPLPSGAATLAAQTQPGVDIGDVTINNSTGTAAVNIQDGGNSITVDGTVALSAGSAVIGHVINDASSAVIGHVIADSGSTTAVTGNVASTVADGANVTLGAKADAKSTATDTTAITMMQVMKQISASVQAPPSQAVTNAGTFVTQSTLAAETTKVIGTVNVASGQTIGLAAGSAVVGHIIADSGSTTAVTGNVASTVADGANVTLGAKADAKSTATDTTAISMMQVMKQISASVQAPPSQAVTNAGTFATQSTLAAETTKIIGTVNVAASQTIATTNAGTFAVQATLQAASGVDIGKLTANQSINTAQVNGNTTVASVTGVQDVMPRKRTGATGLSPNYYAGRITTKTTTTPTAATAYVSAIAFACSGAGTAWTFVIQNKEGTPKILVPSITLTVPTTGPIIMQFNEPILMTSGIDIVTAGTTAGTVDVFITYWQ